MHLRTFLIEQAARLAQLVEREALNLVVVGSSPTVGVLCALQNVSRSFPVSSSETYLVNNGSLAERSKALASGASPKGREFESRSCHFYFACVRAVFFVLENFYFLYAQAGPVAQWIRHRSTEPEIVGSSPTRIILFGG